MSEQQQHKTNQLTSLFHKLRKDLVLAPMDNEGMEKLVWLTKRPALQHLLLHLIYHSLSKDEDVVLRLKSLLMLHKMVSHPISSQTSQLAERILVKHTNNLKRRGMATAKTEDSELYLKMEVEIPYINFLRKMVAWRSLQITEVEAGELEIGFSLINKVKHILQLKRVFHHYGCYFPSHLYALNIFETCLQNIKGFWIAACMKIKTICVQVSKTKEIDPDKFLFISEAEKTQDILMEFVYDNYFSGRIRKDLKIKQLVLLKQEIKDIQNERIKKDAQESALDKVVTKTQRRKTIEGKDSPKPTGVSQQNENIDRLCTEEQLSILESIHQLENLLNM